MTNLGKVTGFEPTERDLLVPRLPLMHGGPEGLDLPGRTPSLSSDQAGTQHLEVVPMACRNRG
jgi:hypothetical protein